MSDTPPRFVVRGAFALARDPLPVRGPFVVARAPRVTSRVRISCGAATSGLDAADLVAAPVDAPVVDADEHDADAPRAVPPVDA